MEELELREWIAYGILAAIVAGGAITAFVHRQRAHWRKLRMAGNPQAKRRELQRRR